ncbi:DUF4417 domain-containing protein [Clostridium amazonitimonense]|uniref:DUF4417 domain-containing protein n=1 Tax=Clostridium amazonitimonense TaxID=1499689 RepID=UPI0005093BA8|nr:DUF4417 domain-containing protein [Clostridium amazonitimonense]
MCEASLCSKICSNCSVICPNKFNDGCIAQGNINLLGGPTFNLLKNKDIKMNINIPVIIDKLKINLDKTRIPLATVPGDVILSSDGMKIKKRFLENTIKEDLRIDTNIGLLIHFYIKDRQLQGFWNNRYQVYKVITKQSPELVIAPNFSVYEDFQRLDHMYNIKRFAIMYNEMISLGINAVPDISYYSIEDIRKRISANTLVTYPSMSLRINVLNSFVLFIQEADVSICFHTGFMPLWSDLNLTNPSCL